MKSAIHDGSARQPSGGPPPVPGPCAAVPVTASLEAELAGLLDRPTQELPLASREVHLSAPPLVLSRDLRIRAFAYQLQDRVHGVSSAALRRRLQSLASASGNGAVDPGIVLKVGTTLVHQWRGHTHTVLVHKDGFEHEGQRYRSLTVIAERITGAHWSGPRFFGLTKRAYTSLPGTSP